MKRLVAALLLALTVGAVAAAVPAFDDVKAAHRPSDLTLLDRHGEPLQTLRVDRQLRRLDWVPLERMSPALLQAVVVGEDRRFWEHGGIDWAAVAQAAWAQGVDGRSRGASTLTMQLAGLVDERFARPPGGRSAWRKLGQAARAAEIERHWSKHQILEAYLNAVPFRGELVGIAALSQTLFGKHPGGLDAQESATAAALLRGPNAAPERVMARACALLQAMQRGCDGLAIRVSQALARRGGMPLGEQLAPHFARLALRVDGTGVGGRADGPAATRSTLDAGLQRVAVRALAQQLAELQGRQVEDGAVVVLDNASGEVRAWVGANGRSSDAAQVDGVLAPRQPGSTLKPFVYGLAIERRLITAASLLDDAPADLATDHGAWRPQNYDRRFKGRVSARTALGASLNVPAVRVGAMLPPDALHARLRGFGLTLKEPAGWYGAALALGGADVTLLELTNAYRALANGGRYAPVALPGRPAAAPRRVADPAASWLVADILADNNARVRTFGLDSQLRTRGFAAVKTGTSKDLRDNWCIGFTDRYTVGVWVGNASGEPMHDVSGISGAAPVWQAVVAWLHREVPSHAAAPPPGLERHPLRYADALEPPRDEWFLSGTAPASPMVAARGLRQGIAHPADGAVFALDPDIPIATQRIRFEGEAGTWVLDGRPLGRGERLHWLPRPGRHELVLKAADGRVIERVRFEVRGLPRVAGARV